MFEQEPDAMEKGIRFGCGAFIGLFIGAGVGIKLLRSDSSLLMLIGAALIGAVICGFLAMLLGDDFWKNMFG